MSNPIHLPVPSVIEPASECHHSRLQQQGWINLRRKPLFALLTLCLTGYLACTRSWLHPMDTLRLPAECIGTGLVLTGIIGRMLATLTIGGRKDREIVCTELYSITRNPLYFCSFLMAVGIGIFTARPDFLGLVTVGFLAIFFPMMKNEARFLSGRFPDFAAYEARVPLFFPNPLLWRERRRLEVDFRLTRKTLQDGMLALLVLPVLGWLAG